MSHFSVCRLKWTKEHITGLSNVLQSLAPSLEGTYSTHKTVTNHYSITQFMESCIEFENMAPIGIVLTGDECLALCYDHEQDHSESFEYQKKVQEAIRAITQAFGQYRGELELERLKSSLPTSTHISVKVHN
jgi:hypothetical protein